MTARLLIAALLLVLFSAPRSAGQALPAASPSMSVVDRTSAERSRERYEERRRSGLLPVAAGAYTLTQVNIPKTDDGSGFFTGTGFQEIIQIMTPFGYDPEGPDLPLILVFNGWGMSAFSFFQGISDIPDEANSRGWLIVAVTCLDDKSYGWITGQIGVEVALDYMIHNYTVDENRIYGVGWSAGGGSIASYAARHLDPDEPMIAAVATNAGTYDLVDVYLNEVPLVQTIMADPNLFQGPPSGATLWNYQRTETEYKDIGSGLVMESLSQMRNLVNTPIYHVYSTDDTILYLPNQSVLFANYLIAKGASITSTSFSGLPTPHTWDILPGTTTLDWLQQHTLQQEPAEFEVNADRDGSFYWATVDVSNESTFAGISCAADSGTNDLQVTVSNAIELLLEPPASALAIGSDFTMSLDNQTGSAMTVILGGVQVMPTTLLLGGSPFANWTFEPVSDQLSLTLPTGTSNISVQYSDYSGILTGPASVAAGSNLIFNLTASEENKPYLLLVGAAPGVVPLSLFDPADSRDLLIGLNPLPIFMPPLTLNGAAQASVDTGAIPGPLAGTTLYCQFVTFPGGNTIVDEISNRLDVAITPGS